jgi:glycosyltransferase involved in cell wall biosynthesis
MSKQIIIIPAFNEYYSLKKIFNDISKKFKIIIINDASTDKTKKFLEKNKIENIENKKNKGYEKSIIEGFKYVAKHYPKTKSIVTFDADGEHNTFDLSRILKFYNSNNPDLLVCNRTNIKRNSERFIDSIFKAKYGINDPLSGLKVYKTKILKKFFKKFKFKYFLVDLVILYCKRKYKVLNLSITCNYKKNRKARIGNQEKANKKIFNISKII